MKRFMVAIIVAMLPIPVHAQDMPGGKRHHKQTQSAEQPKLKADDKAYRSAIDSLPDQPYDPWQSVREPPKQNVSSPGKGAH